MAVPTGRSAKGVTFGAFQRCVASFRVAGVALRDIPTCLVTCQKSFCLAGAILLKAFSEDELQTFVAGAALWTPPMFSFAWQGQHFRRVEM